MGGKPRTPLQEPFLSLHFTEQAARDVYKYLAPQWIQSKTTKEVVRLLGKALK